METKNQMDVDVNKMVKIIESCTTKEHFEASARMIDLFEAKWKFRLTVTNSDLLISRHVDAYTIYLLGFKIGYENAVITYIHNKK